MIVKAGKLMVLVLLMGIQNGPDSSPPLDWIRVVKMVSHKQINSLVRGEPTRKIYFVGLGAHTCWKRIGTSQPKKRCLKVRLEERDDVSDGGSDLGPDDAGTILDNSLLISLKLLSKGFTM